MHLIVDKSKENTKLPRVIKAAVELFVEKGIDGTTIKDIAAKADVSEGALYRHYKSKEELAWSIFSTQVNEFSVELMGRVSQVTTAKAKIEAYISTCFKAYEEEKDLFIYLIVSEHRELRNFPSTNIHPGHVALKMIEEGQKAGEIKQMDVYVAGSILLGSIIRMCLARMYGNIKQKLEHYEKELSDSVWHAIKM